MANKSTLQIAQILLLCVFLVQVTESAVELKNIQVKLDVKNVIVKERYCETLSKCDDFTVCAEKFDGYYLCNGHDGKEFDIQNELHITVTYPISVYEVFYEEKEDESVRLEVTGTNCDIYITTNCPQNSEVTCFPKRLNYPVWNFTAGEMDDCPMNIETQHWILAFVILIFVAILFFGYFFLCSGVLCLGSLGFEILIVSVCGCICTFVAGRSSGKKSSGNKSSKNLNEKFIKMNDGED